MLRFLNKRPARREQTEGFSLIEVLIASSVMLVAILGVLGIFAQAYFTTTFSGRKSILNHLAAEKMEDLKSIDYNHADLAAGTHPAQSTDSGGNRYYQVPGFPEEFSVRWIVSAGPTDGTNTAETQMKTVLVEATYETRYTVGHAEITNPNSRKVTLRTFLSE